MRMHPSDTHHGATSNQQRQRYIKRRVPHNDKENKNKRKKDHRREE